VKLSAASRERVAALRRTIHQLEREPQETALALPRALIQGVSRAIQRLDTADDLLRRELRSRCGLGRSSAVGWLLSDMLEVNIDMIFKHFENIFPEMIELQRELTLRMLNTTDVVVVNPALLARCNL
jgi:hypothetical protein